MQSMKEHKRIMAITNSETKKNRKLKAHVEYANKNLFNTPGIKYLPFDYCCCHVSLELIKLRMMMKNHMILCNLTYKKSCPTFLCALSALSHTVASNQLRNYIDEKGLHLISTLLVTITIIIMLMLISCLCYIHTIALCAIIFIVNALDVSCV
jgi:hypothetical protein